MTAGLYRIQVQRGVRWITHCRTQGLPLAQEIAQRLRSDGQTVRITRRIVHRSRSHTPGGATSPTTQKESTMNTWTNVDADDPRQDALEAECYAERQREHEEEEAAHQHLWEAVQQAMQREGARP
jgi:hypothetical protein